MLHQFIDRIKLNIENRAWGTSGMHHPWDAVDGAIDFRSESLPLNFIDWNESAESPEES